MLLSIPVSIGEVIDKITILEIKSNRIKSLEKLENINKELSILNHEISQVEGLWDRIARLYSELKAINEELWDIEDDIRVKEYHKEFDEEFIRLARSVYVTNDKRADAKMRINKLLGSELIEEKSYESYS